MPALDSGSVPQILFGGLPRKDLLRLNLYQICIKLSAVTKTPSPRPLGHYRVMPPLNLREALQFDATSSSNDIHPRTYDIRLAISDVAPNASYPIPSATISDWRMQ